jgi:coenzyme F420-reducing hydrogenase beta subunit
MAEDQAENCGNYEAQNKAQIVQKFFRRTKDKQFGVFNNIFSAKSNIDGQDGGVVTALLLNGLKEGIFDVAIVVRSVNGYNAEAIEVDTPSGILAAKGTKYFRINVTRKLRELIKQGKKRVAIVCTPCEAKAARKIQQTLKNDCEITIIGLFCFEAFDSGKLKEKIWTQLNLDLDNVQKTQIRRGKFTAFADGKEYSCKVKDLLGATEKVCRYCDDFTAQEADVSVGSVGSDSGYSTVIIRSMTGENCLKTLDIIKASADNEEISRVAKAKRERAKKSLADLNNRQ